MMLMSTDLGRDSLWFTFFNPSSLKQILNIPEKLDVAGAVMIGTPAAEAKAPKRKTPEIYQDMYN